MKKILSTLFFAGIALISFAQEKPDASKHLSFKGVPIDGTLAEYVIKMKQAGFTHKGTEDGISILHGDFAAYKNCTVGVSTLKQKDLVNKIVVVFPEQDTWSSLSGNYFNLKDLLTEKYGNPSDCVEEFQSRLQPKDDGDKMHEVRMDRCKYYTVYDTEKGSIRLSIEHNSVTRCFVKLIYQDKINSETVKKQAIDDL